MKKLSKYTVLHEQDCRAYVFHQMSEALLEIDEELETALKTGNIQSIPSDILSYLEEKGFIVEDNVDETCNLRYANMVNRYNSKLLRVTILPTMNCNFKCWYCYEQHKPSMMSDDDNKAIVKFVKTEAKAKNVKEIMLDWFGGEPLLRFNQTIYPIAKEIANWCKENDFAFTNAITTNGSLITEDMAKMMDETGLRQFQITLDGGKDEHNKTKSSPAMKDSYSVTVKNIHTLCRVINNPHIELRINYTKENIDSAFTILDDFDERIRHFITISPHIVWQKSGDAEALKDKVQALRAKAEEKGYNVSKQNLLLKCATYYIDNMEQFVINYDMNVYKCTARDFCERYSIGRINGDGVFEPNNLYYKYYTTESPFMRKECLECELLPSCLYSLACLQKKIEGVYPECNKNSVSLSLHNEISRKITCNNNIK